MRLCILFIPFILISNVFSQTKKSVDQDAYFKWARVKDYKFTDDGKWISYGITRLWSDDTLVIMNKKGFEKRFPRSTNANWDHQSRFVAFTTKNFHDSVRQLELDKISKKKWPKDSLKVYNIKKDTTIFFTNYESYDFGEEGGDWMIIQRDKEYKPAFSVTPANKGKKKCLFKRKKKDDEKNERVVKSLGKYLTLYNPIKDSSFFLANVSQYEVDYYGSKLAYEQSYKINDSLDSTSVKILDFGTLTTDTIFSRYGISKTLKLDRSGNNLAFFYTPDTAKIKKYSIFHSHSSAKASMLVDSVSSDFYSHQTLSLNGGLRFSRDGSKLYFGAGNREYDRKDTLTKKEKTSVQVWHWNDGQIMPEQNLSKRRDLKSTRPFVYHIQSKNITALADTSKMSISYNDFRNSDFALERNPLPYQKLVTWDFWYYDYNRINLKTGEKKSLKKKLLGWSGNLSNSGDYFIYWEVADSNWKLLEVNTGKETNLTASINDKFYDKYHDVPGGIDPAGSPQWLENDQGVMLFSQNDVWIIPMKGKAYRLTKGKENNMSFSYLRLDPEEQSVSLQRGFHLKGFHYEDKSESIWKYGDNGIEKLYQIDAQILTVKKAKNSNDIMIRNMTLQKYPDLMWGDLSFKNFKQVSDINPQQKNYNWANVELIKYKDYNGKIIEGLLYTPENLDRSKKYPMIVYYYERYSHDIHNYYAPRPSASTIHPTEYASNNYVVFIPDITYDEGHPAKGAYNAIMSGTDHIIKNYSFVDSTKMGLQGQSWGGYQTAQLVTMTKRFACAMAGAPVSNMFSAYGGIRWGSGLSRAFQYETGQSRIGKNIWEGHNLYMENSPIFHLPNVTTPLLIMHNDEDGAVPWYQGIELYMGLRRLEKKVWLLNYSGDDHNLMKTGNRLDLSIKMKGFFDHYLHGVDAPKWLIEGVPAVDRH